MQLDSDLLNFRFQKKKKTKNTHTHNLEKLENVKKQKKSANVAQKLRSEFVTQSGIVKLAKLGSIRAGLIYRH